MSGEEREASAAAESGRLTPSFRPQQVDHLPHCQAGCPISGDVRGWIGIVAQRGKTGLADDEAYRLAWERITDRNPFPSSLGRVCPHPCESHCNRNAFDAPVSINAMERFLGDWAIERRLSLPRVDDDPKPESIGVIGAGPSGLSFAYQMARRGYPVTIYERREEAGGMMRFGIPDYRLPRDVLGAEIDRILELGVELRLSTAVGQEVTPAELRERHAVLYVGVGAQRSRRLGVPGDDDPSVLGATELLARASRHEPLAIGSRCAVVGGGNSAVDVARTTRRAGAAATIVYRRTRAEMPAFAAEVDEALDEGVELLELLAPLRVERDGDRLRLVCQRMELGEPDASGRRRPVPLDGPAHVLEVDSIVVAVSQAPVWEGLEALHDGDWLVVAEDGSVTPGVWGGGDALGLGIAGDAIAHGRRAAEAVHARLRGLPPVQPEGRPPIGHDGVLLDWYARAERAEPPRLPVDAALAEPDAEVHGRIDEEAFLAEARRCLSCGLCLGCEQCWMYCTAPSFTRAADPSPGAYFTLSLEACRECGKCVDVCPCGYLQLAPSA